MKNKFHQIVNKLANDNTLAMYPSESLLYQHTSPYLKLTLPREGVGELMFSPDVTQFIDEHHMTIFEDLEQQGEHSAFHYTAKLHRSDEFHVYRLRVFFNDKDQPIGVSWYRKAPGESDDLYLQVELTAREIKLTMDFAAEQIKLLVSLIHDQQITQVNNAKERYEAFYRAYDELIDAQVEGAPFAIGQALTYLADMKKCLYLQEELGIRSARSKLAYIRRLEALTQTTHQPVIEKKAIDMSVSSIAESNLDDSLVINFSQAVKVSDVSKPRIQTTELERIYSDISLKHSAIPDAFKVIPTTTKKILNHDYLIFMEGLQNDYRECCQQYLLNMETHSSISELKHFKKLNRTMDLIAKEQEQIESKYAQTLLLFGDQTPDIIERLRACKSAIESLMMNSIKLVIRNNKSNFLQLILEYKKFTTVELVDIMKVILATDSGTECFSDILKRYRIHSFLLQKDSTNVLLAMYLFRLPLVHPMRLACVYDIPALSSSTFYQKLYVELQKSKDEALYDATTLERDIDHVRMAESLYASSSEQKHQIRLNIEWIRQLPASIQAVLGRMSFEPGSSCEKKMTLIYQISREINTTIALLSVSNPAFVSRLKQESSSQLRQFKTVISENEANFVEYLSTVDARRLEHDLDEIIEYSHLLNNYLRYCLPTSMDVLSDAARTELREHYFGELKRFGMKKNPYEAFQGALSAMADGMRALESLMETQINQLQYLHDHPDDVTLSDIQAFMSGFEAISSFTQAVQPLLDARETAPIKSISRSS